MSAPTDDAGTPDSFFTPRKRPVPPADRESGRTPEETTGGRTPSAAPQVPAPRTEPEQGRPETPRGPAARSGPARPAADRPRRSNEETMALRLPPPPLTGDAPRTGAPPRPVRADGPPPQGSRPADRPGGNGERGQPDFRTPVPGRARPSAVPGAPAPARQGQPDFRTPAAPGATASQSAPMSPDRTMALRIPTAFRPAGTTAPEIGRASCRERVL